MLRAMRVSLLPLLSFSLPLMLAACPPSTPTGDAGVVDGGAQDAGSPDGGPEDGGPVDGGSTPRALCDVDAGPVPTPVTGDVTYGQVETYPCFLDACMCDESARGFTGRLLACEAVRGGYYWAQGSTTVTVVGSEAGECVLDVAREVEGGVSMLRCRLPLPLSPWPGLATGGAGETAPDLLLGIQDRCVQIGSCNFIFGAPNFCDDLEDPPFVCPDAQGTLPCDAP